MTADHEPSNQSFEIDREATVCTASRCLPLSGRDSTLHLRHAFLVGVLTPYENAANGTG
jgi:hypothetical protein